jgi:pimeloyl-ACP methyl ester carboxylesterase
MPEWFDGHVISNGMGIHHYRTGRNEFQVIFNRGAVDDGLCWTWVVNELEKDFDVIVPDARGHGKSASGKGDYFTRQRVSDLVGLIEALKHDIRRTLFDGYLPALKRFLYEVYQIDSPFLGGAATRTA